jgi:DNA-binding response OmpR family regulator
MKPRILVIEDDPDIAESIRYNLERGSEFTVDVALSGEEGLSLARQIGTDQKPAPPALTILDLNLPGVSGFEICRRLRADAATARVPILMLTARVDENDKVRGLEVGADDYITKPFSVRELTARVRAALRRAGFEAPSSEIYDDGCLRVDYQGFTVSCGGEEIKLARKEFALLTILSKQPGRVIPRERLLDEVWGLAYYGEARTLDVHISGLRRKLGNCGSCIETMIGVGYRFRSCAEAEAADAQAG